MAEKRFVAVTAPKDPPYTAVQGELLAEAVLAKMPELKARAAGDDKPYAYVVSTKQGAEFFVVVQAFSSIRREWSESMAEWPWDVDAGLVRLARGSETPMVLFVFDADSSQGRFFELGALPEPPTLTTERSPVPLPNGQIISEASLAQLAAKFDAKRSA